MSNLTKKICKPCEGGMSPLNKVQIGKLINQIPEWEVSENISLRRKFKFKNFKEALNFMNKVGELAEKEGHHPDIKLGWGYLDIELTTHSIKGLSENDFIMAAKINTIK